MCLLLACCCLLKLVAQPWPLKGGVKPREGKPSSVIKTRTRTELGPSLVSLWKKDRLPWGILGFVPLSNEAK